MLDGVLQTESKCDIPRTNIDTTAGSYQHMGMTNHPTVDVEASNRGRRVYLTLVIRFNHHTRGRQGSSESLHCT